MQLCNINLVDVEGFRNIQVKSGLISIVAGDESFPANLPGETRISFKNAIAFPGLINSHDHLDFNLFPQTGNRIYHNYKEWSTDIQVANKELINSILKIDVATRTRWGLYKNLINGITTVVNHGKKNAFAYNLVNVIQNNYSLHSLEFEKNWKLKLNRILTKDQPYVIHIGEGTDDASYEEIDRMVRWNLFRRKLIGVHGVAMDEKQAESFEALVWCPVSNYFLLGKTAAIDKLKTKTAILFGTDSTLTAEWNLWEHLRLARSTNLMSDRELFEMLTTRPAAIWNLKNTGKIAENYVADIVIARRRGDSNNFNLFFSLNPEDILLVLCKGEIKLFDETLLETLKTPDFNATKFSKIIVAESCKYVQGNLPEPTSYVGFTSEQKN
ncbi:MAG: amidohydrolase family protein [Ginsengibacter sp.]